MSQSRLASRMNGTIGSEVAALLRLVDRPDIISFAGGVPETTLFPAEAFSKAYAEALAEGSYQTALQYSSPDGNKGLRSWIVQEMGRLGVPCGIDNVLITTGSQQALDFVGKVFLSPGDTALVAWPTYLGALQAFNAYEPNYDRLTPLGNRSAADYRATAQEKGGRVKFAYLSVDFANPTGETLTQAERERVLDLAEDIDIAVIEDGAYQTLRYEGEEVPAILALEIARKGDIEACRTVYCGTFSKTISPGLRIGWVCAARETIEKLAGLKQAAELHSSTINQMVMDKVARAEFSNQVDKARKTYSERRDHMLAALKRHMPEGVRWSEPEGGMFVWMTLPEGLDADALLVEAVETEKVAFVPGRPFFADGSGANTLRLSFSNNPPDLIDEGMARLARLIRTKIAQ